MKIFALINAFIITCSIFLTFKINIIYLINIKLFIFSNIKTKNLINNKFECFSKKMESTDFKDFAKSMMDYIADYLENIRDR